MEDLRIVYVEFLPVYFFLDEEINWRLKIEGSYSLALIEQEEDI